VAATVQRPGAIHNRDVLDPLECQQFIVAISGQLARCRIDGRFDVFWHQDESESHYSFSLCRFDSSRENNYPMKSLPNWPNHSFSISAR
jgi:hypothetical protein